MRTDKRCIDVAVLLAGNDGYGVRRSILNQFLLAADYGIKFHYICITEGQLSRDLLKLGANLRIIGSRIPVAYPPNLFSLLKICLVYSRDWAKIIKEVTAYLRETKPDVLYTHKPTEHILGGLAAKFCGVKAVAHLRWQINSERNWGLSRILYSLLLFYSMDLGIAISRAVRNSFVGRARNKIHCIYNGLDIQKIREEIQRSDEGFRIGRPYIISVGRLVRIKKQDILIEAFDILLRQGFDLDLVLVGGPADQSNPYYLELKRRVAGRGLSDRVHFLGYIEHPYSILANAVASVLCCTKEAFGNIVVESMVCGTPVVVPDAGGASELVRHNVNGLKFKPDSPEHLADALRVLVVDAQQRDKYTKNAYSEAEDRFSIQRHMSELREKFCLLVGNQ